MSESKPMEVVCRFCGVRLSLNRDSEAARISGTDPLRQMKRHIGECGAGLQAGFNGAILINALMFQPLYAADQERYRSNLVAILDWLIDGGMVRDLAPGTANARPPQAGPVSPEATKK